MCYFAFFTIIIAKQKWNVQSMTPFNGRNWIFWRWLVNDRQSQYIIRTNNKNNHASSGSRKQYKWHFIVSHLHMIISKQYKPRCYSSVMFHICPTSISTKAYIENNNQTSPNYLYLLLSIQTALNMIMLNIDPCWHGNRKIIWCSLL